jgi:hypothetical protein
MHEIESGGMLTKSDQMLFLYTWAKENCPGVMTNDDIAQIYSTTAGNVRTILSRAKTGLVRPYRPPGRPFIMSDEQENGIIRYIQTQSNLNEYVTQCEILKYIEAQYGLIQSHSWFAQFLERHSEEIIRSVAVPQENLRLEVPRIWLNEYLELITKIVPLACCELIYNLDETGLSEWEERRRKNVIASAATIGKTLHYRANRGIRHQTLLCTVSAGGDAYSPLLLSSEPSTLRLFETPIRRNIDLSIEIKDSAYVDTSTFRDYVSNRIIPHITSDRNGELPADTPAILFFDNCGSHCKDDVLESLARVWVMVITYPPHTSGIFQVLDKLIFGVLKRAKRHTPKDDKLPAAAYHARRVFVVYEHATTSETIRSAWVKSGFDYVKRDEVWYMTINESRIRESGEFKEVWDRNYQEQNLSERRRMQKWGWINRSWFPKRFQEFVLGTENEDEF